MAAKGTLLVTGASGFLGWHLVQAAAADWRVVGTYAQRSLHPSVSGIQLDLQDPVALKQALEQVRPDAVIHLAAIASPNRCQEEPALSQRVNVEATRELATLCGDRQIPFLFTSTDLVFDGRQAPYSETDPVSPINRYGEQKALAEAIVLQSYPQATVCRLPLMFGAAPPQASSFLQPFLHTLRSGQPLKLFVDEFRTPVSATTAVHGLLLALGQVAGRLHLGGRERISRYQFGLMMAEIWGLPQEQILPCGQPDIPMAAARPADVSLNSRQAFELGYAPLTIREELAQLRQQV